jgi:hypothetical protein
MNKSDWSIETLKEYFEKVLAEKDKAINIALAAAKEAVGVAEANSEKWRSNANEWRGAMTDREKTFVSRAEFESYKTSADKALSLEKERADKGQGKNEATKYIIALLLAIAGMAIGYFLKK